MVDELVEFPGRPRFGVVVLLTGKTTVVPLEFDVVVALTTYPVV